MRVTKAVVSLLLLTAAAWAQHQHHGMHQAAKVALAVRDDSAAQVLHLRLGPLKLPAGSDHTAVAQPEDVFLDIPFDGWLVAYHPRLVDGAGKPMSSRLLHHVAFWNTARSDFLCPNKEEHIFGAGGEMNDWPAVPGMGYRVRRGERIRVSTMFHNPTATDYPQTFLEVEVDYRTAGPLKSVYPAWFDVRECRSSSYNVKAGQNVERGRFQMAFGGMLLGVGGHLHDFGGRVELTNTTRGETIATLDAQLGEAGNIVSMPVLTFFEQGGYRLNKGEVIEASATYQDRDLPGVMGIVVGYFLPNNDEEMATLERQGRMRAAE